MTTKWKPIRPKELQVKFFRLETANKMRKVAPNVAKDFEKTISAWQGKKPSIDSEINTPGGNIALFVGLGGDPDAIQKWVWQDEGTEPHTITPLSGDFLVFQEGYTRVTKKGVLDTGPGGPFGETVFSTGVNHPGFEGNEWLDLLVRIWAPKFKKAFGDAINVAAKKSGHSI